MLAGGGTVARQPNGRRTGCAAKPGRDQRCGGTAWWQGQQQESNEGLDFELRHTNLKLRNSDDLADVIEARASAASASIWARRRVPTGWVALERPVRHVVEGAFARFLGGQTEVDVDRQAIRVARPGGELLTGQGLLL
jgi:hypothetical protein